MHAELARKAEDAFAVEGALECLQKCRALLEALERLLRKGQLPEAVKMTGELQRQLDAAPSAASSADIMVELKVSGYGASAEICTFDRVERPSFAL